MSSNPTRRAAPSPVVVETFTSVNPDEQMAHVVGAIRNHLVGTGVIFTPIQGLQLTCRNGQLYRVGLLGTQRQFSPLATVDQLLQMSDLQIWQAVMEPTNKRTKQR